MINDYEVIKSKRKSAAIEITRELKIKIRVPKYYTDNMVKELVNKNEAWISSSYEKQKRRFELYRGADEKALRELAAEILPKKAEYFGKLMNLKPASVKITGAKTRFGSCSAKNGLCFSWRLMVYPEEAIDYVVVHEIAHIRYHNHGREFYKLIESYMPDYRERIAILRGDINEY